MAILTGEKLDEKCEELLTSGAPDDLVVSYSYFAGGSKDVIPEHRTTTFKELLQEHIECQVELQTWKELKDNSQIRRDAAKVTINDIKGRVPAFVFGRIKPGGKRQKSDMEAYYGLVLDCDNLGRAQYESLLENLEESGYICAVYSTFSHDHPQGSCIKLRVVIPFGEELTTGSGGSDELLKNYKNVYDNFVKKWNIPKPDAASKSASQCFYLPSYMQLVSKEDMCHTPEKILRYVVGRRLVNPAHYLQTLTNRREYTKHAMLEAWKKGLCENSAEGLEKYTMGNIVPGLEDPKSFNSATVAPLAKWIAEQGDYGKFKLRDNLKKAGKRKGPSNEEMQSFVKSLNPLHYWRVYKYTFKDKEGNEVLFEEKSTGLDLAVQFEQQTGWTISIDKMKQYFYAVADCHACRRDPFREMLERVQWDGKVRYKELFTLREGTSYPEMRQDYVKKWLISIVARSLQEEQEKVDTMLVLQGVQGNGKSTFFRSLVGRDNFTDGIHDISSSNLKDVMLTVRGKVIAEVAEMEKLFSKGQSLLKAFLSQACDDVRDPYERKVERQTRKVVFVGSTNEETFLTDRTGNRRYLVVPTDDRYLKPVTAEFAEQVWAEAVHYYRSGEKWYYDEPKDKARVEEINHEYTPVDDLLLRVAGVVESGMLPTKNFTGGDVCEVMCVDRSRYATAVTRCLKKLGFVYKNRKVNGIPVLGFNSTDRNV